MTTFAGEDVSVVIPTHNRPEKLVHAANSVNEQSIELGELIVVNDGSDRSYSDAQDHLDSLSISTTYLETEGRGAAAARNFGASHATGDVLMFLDDDDRWRPEKAERQLELLTDEVGLVYSARIVVDQNGYEQFRIESGETGDLSRDVLIYNPIGTTSSPAIRADVFESVGGFDERMPGLQDWDLWIRICQVTRVGYDPRHTVEWTSHDEAGEQMTSQCDRYLEAVRLLQEKYADQYEQLSWTERRKVRAHHHKALAKKYSTVGSRTKYEYIFRSLWQWPSTSAAARLFPPRVVTKLRKIVHA